MYHIQDSHEPIVSLEQFNAVQEEIQRRAKKHYSPTHNRRKYPFSGLLRCEGCGKYFQRKITAAGAVWICPTFNSQGKAFCQAKQIPESILISITEEFLGSLDALPGKITVIRAEKNNTLVFCFRDGTEVVKQWQDRSRRQSWTPEMKEAARRKTLKRRAQHEAG